MVARDLKILASETKNTLGKYWSPVWIPFNDRFYIVTPIYFITPPLPGISILSNNPEAFHGIAADT